MSTPELSSQPIGKSPFYCPDPGGYSLENPAALGPGWRLAVAAVGRAGGGGRGGGRCGERRGVKGGGGSHLCRAGAAAIAAHSPRALFGAGGSAGSELASARSPGQQRGHPAAACTAASAALGGPARSEGESKSPGAEPGETQLREGARPALPPPARERENPRRSPRGRESWERRSPQPQGWSSRRREARYSAPCRGSPPPADLPGLRAGAAQAGEVSCARAAECAERASERARKAAELGGHGLGGAAAAARDGWTCCACWRCSPAACSPCAGRASTPTTGRSKSPAASRRPTALPASTASST